MHDRNEAEMDALVWLGPRQMVLRAEPVPAVGAGDVLLQVTAAGICGSELSGYLGQNSLRRPPLVMGHEAAGRIAQAASGTLADGSTPHAGQRVTFNPLVACGICDLCRAGRMNLCRNRTLIGAHRPGAFAQFVAVPAAQCLPLPDHLGDVAGSLTEPFACAIRAVTLSRAGPGDPLLILGAGPIGLCCVAAARAAGVEQIMISDIAAQRLAVAEQWGAHEVVNAREQDVSAAAQAFAPGGVAAVIDAVGTDATRGQAIEAVIPGGRVVFIGLHAEASPLAANYLIRQEITITGSFTYTMDEFKQALDLLSQGVVRPSQDWLEERPLDAGAAAFDELVDGRAATSKIVLRIA